MSDDGIMLKSFSLDWKGWAFFVIYGKNRDGWFMAMPNWEICLKIACPENIDYNAKKIESALKIEGSGMILAESIKEKCSQLPIA